MCQEAIFEVRLKVTSVQNEVGICFEEVNGERFGVVGTDEIIIYFVNRKEVFPLLKLGGTLDDCGIEFFWNAVECEAVVGGKDKLLFQPEAFLEFFNMGQKFNYLRGDVVNEVCRFEPIITFS